jgi:hypothetical protein
MGRVCNGFTRGDSRGDSRVCDGFTRGDSRVCDGFTRGYGRLIGVWQWISKVSGDVRVKSRHHGMFVTVDGVPKFIGGSSVYLHIAWLAIVVNPAFVEVMVSRYTAIAIWHSFCVWVPRSLSIVPLTIVGGFRSHPLMFVGGFHGHIIPCSQGNDPTLIFNIPMISALMPNIVPSIYHSPPFTVPTTTIFMTSLISVPAIPAASLLF